MNTLRVRIRSCLEIFAPPNNQYLEYFFLDLACCRVEAVRFRVYGLHLALRVLQFCFVLLQKCIADDLAALHGNQII